MLEKLIFENKSKYEKKSVAQRIRRSWKTVVGGSKTARSFFRSLLNSKRQGYELLLTDEEKRLVLEMLQK